MTSDAVATEQTARGYVGNTDKVAPAWWGAEQLANKALFDAIRHDDYDIETGSLVALFTFLSPQLTMRGAGSYYQDFLKKAQQCGLFDKELNTLERYLQFNDWRSLYLILEKYLTQTHTHHGDYRPEGKSNTMGIPPAWLENDEVNVVLNPSCWYEEGLTTLIIGENGCGKTNLMAWLVAISAMKKGYGMLPIWMSNLKFYEHYANQYRVQKVRAISEVFGVVAKVDMTGEERKMIMLVDEFDHSRGANAWETRSKRASASFLILNQIRKLQGLITIVGIHFEQDINVRWRGGQGISTIINKGMRYPSKGKKGPFDCVRVTDNLSRKQSAAIWWNNVPINLNCIPNVPVFETRGNTTFDFDLSPDDIREMFLRIDKIPLPEYGYEEERMNWRIMRGETIQKFLKEWREEMNRKDNNANHKAREQEFKQAMFSEAVTLQEQGKTVRQIYAGFLEKLKGHEFYNSIPSKYGTFEQALNRYKNNIRGPS